MVAMLHKAFSHTLEEIGLHTVWESLKVDLESIRKGHDSIHEFTYIAPLMFPHEGGPSWHRYSAFLLYHWEVGYAAHRSLIEALCGYYNSAFTLLRTALELALKGALYEGLAHRKFRATSQALEKDPGGRNLKQFLDDLISKQPSISDDLGDTSAAIYDMIESIVDNARYRPSLKTILMQLSEWGFLHPIRAVQEIRDVYMRLSKEVHVLPDYTDIGRILLKETDELFEPRKVDKAVLGEYMLVERFVVDACTVVELNVLKDNMKFNQVRSNLAARVEYLKDLGMTVSAQAATELLG